ncbi:hypothetical protein DFP72DRAFT_1091935 [Ephemerocybe angulata]|uniref:Fungal-type protein kinase domain-containing protein n=1 Tax=Ephemerocybe angulata TaxID=980116 RepID=A0A8H6M9C8_9AGAR|nr:hypothetical protein DFP72DRAFT_1091935 [Tulosesus angulatus]
MPAPSGPSTRTRARTRRSREQATTTQPALTSETPGAPELVVEATSSITNPAGTATSLHAPRQLPTPDRNHNDTSEPSSELNAPTDEERPPKSQLRKSQELFERMRFSTPIKEDSQHANGPNMQQKEIILAELQDIPNCSADFLKKAYNAKNTVDNRTIKKFLAESGLYVGGKVDEESGLYGGGRWGDIPEEIELEDELYAPLLKIIKHIVEGPGKGLGSREAIDTHIRWFVHHDGEKTRPDIAIKATGPSFQVPLPMASQKSGEPPIVVVGYSNVASVFDVKRNVDNITKKQIEQMATYNRQIFISQPNRKFCRSLIITETHVRLLHYDRSGAFTTDFVNYHDEPYTFVRLVLGLSSLDEENIGLDTSIQWTVDANGRKVAGTITAIDDQTKATTVYDLIMEEPPLIRHAIIGTGMICWHALDKDKQRFIIKDYWRATGRTPESEFLKRVTKVKGTLAKVDSFAAKRAKTKDYRPKNFESKDFFNRTLSRMALAVPGRSLVHFTSQKQAIRAIRDAIQAHCNLLIGHILHRDVTVDSILLNDNPKPDELSSVLIDLSMAMPAEGERIKLSPEGRTGNKIFRSYAVLRSGMAEQILSPVAHDYLDDLEAFFYVLCYLIHRFAGPGLPVSGEHPVLLQWAGNDCSIAAERKSRYLRVEGPGAHLPPSFWSSATLKLADDYRAFLIKGLDIKTTIRAASGPSYVIPTPASMAPQLRMQLYDHIDGHYAQVLGFFNTALDSLDQPGGDAPRVLRIPPPWIPSNQIRYHSPPVALSDDGSDLETGYKLYVSSPDRADSIASTSPVSRLSKRGSSEISDDEDGPATKCRRGEDDADGNRLYDILEQAGAEDGED